MWFRMQRIAIGVITNYRYQHSVLCAETTVILCTLICKYKHEHFCNIVKHLQLQCVKIEQFIHGQNLIYYFHYFKSANHAV